MPDKHHGLDALVKPLRLANNDAGQCSPTQELVDAFPMANGKQITEAGSGYNAQNPYVGRDQRFYAAIAYNGSKMKGTTSGPPLQEITVETYKGDKISMQILQQKFIIPSRDTIGLNQLIRKTPSIPMVMEARSPGSSFDTRRSC
ncbi:RagB/SusD family nutrient uptake outer membrane protein [Sphingobacterium sp. E70]|nr:RagB/SusD family nutrient uptake outer membrane protein [Sphingobacterium sp. E70]